MKILGFHSGHDVSYCILDNGIPIDKVIDRKKWGFCGSAMNIISNPVVDYAENCILKSDWMNEHFNISE